MSADAGRGVAPLGIGRRQLLLVLLLAGCGQARRGTRSPVPPSRMGGDDEFARLVLQHHAGVHEARERLLQHPASAAIVRHRQLMGDAHASRASVVDDVLARTVDTHAIASMLPMLAKMRETFKAHARLALDHLPDGTRIDGNLYFIVGYDIGIAAPPDIAINIGHEHFLAKPSEIAHYVTHEAHHVGFMAARPPPPLASLDDPRVLRSVVAYFTELEGRAVHAARDARARDGGLGDDDDYLVYRDPSLATQVTSRFTELWRMLRRATPLTDDEIGTVMNAMSSGERLFYRMGAIVSDRIERKRGRGYLAASVRDPEAFASELNRIAAGTAPA